MKISDRAPFVPLALVLSIIVGGEFKF